MFSYQDIKVIKAETPIACSIVAVYPDHASAERAVRHLHEAGFALGELSIVGREFQESDRPYRFVSRRHDSEAGPRPGRYSGGTSAGSSGLRSFSCRAPLEKEAACRLPALLDCSNSALSRSTSASNSSICRDWRRGRSKSAS
jgi:hypothetical protein